MSIPLNIDIQQILLHLFNFAILGFGLYILLFRPVKDFMDKRAQSIQKLNDEAETKLKSANDYETKVRAELARISDETAGEKSRILNEARQEADQEIKKARDEATKIIENAKASGEAEKQKIISSAGEDIVELAASTAYKLLKEAHEDE